MTKKGVKRSRRVQYPAAGVQSDFEVLLQKFVDTKSIRYEEFARLWREGNYSLIHAGRNGLREKREFIEETFKIIFKFALPPYTLQVRVGALYALYGVYHTQKMKNKIKVRVPLSCWGDIKSLHEEVIKNQHLDVDYIIRKMMHDGVFEYVAYPSPLSLDDFYKDEEEEGDDCFVDEPDNSSNTWDRDNNLLNTLLDEDSLGQLNAVHNKYHQLKCQLHAALGGDPNTPGASLDLIEDDVINTIVKVAQQPQVTVTSPSGQGRGRKKRKEKSRKESTSERASRIREIKKRALKARANTDSGSLRYLNTSPERGDNPTNKKSQTTRQRATKATPKRRAKNKRPPVRADFDDSDDHSDVSDEDIKAIISSISQHATKKIKSMKKKTYKRAKKQKTVSGSPWLDIDSNEDDDEDFSLDDDDDDEDNDTDENDNDDLISTTRLPRRASKRLRRKRVSLDDSEGLSPSSSIGSEASKYVNKRKSRTPKRIVRSKGSSADQSQDSKPSRDESFSPIEKRRKLSLSPSSKKTTSCDDDDEDDGEPRSKRLRMEKGSHVTIPTEDESLKIEVKENDMIAFKPVWKWVERPLVGKVVTVTNNFVTVIWYYGGYLTKWVPWTVGKGEDKKIQREKVSRKEILVPGFQLTAAGKLPVKISKDLRKMYNQLDKS